jgi:hypothetical protein
MKLTKTTIDMSKLTGFTPNRGNMPVSSEINSAMQALNIAVQYRAVMDHTSKGPSFFPPPTDRRETIISSGLEVISSLTIQLQHDLTLAIHRSGLGIIRQCEQANRRFI